MQAIEFLDANHIEYQRVDHPAVFTNEEAKAVIPELPGARTKNLFLRSRKSERLFLLVFQEDKFIDLTALAKHLGAGRFNFASPEQLQEFLGVQPGAVSVLSIMNDSAQRVELVIDAEVWADTAILCHPLVNTATLSLSMEQLRRFLDLLGRTPQILRLPLKKP